MHEPMKRSNRDATVFDIALWRDGSNGTKMVTVGGDGCLCVARLDDGKAVVLGSSYPDEQWHASASGSGPSKQYRYAAVHRVAVNEATGVALTGSQFESVCHLWDLRSKKTSAKGKQLGSTPRVASGNPNKVRHAVHACAPHRLMVFNTVAPATRWHSPPSRHTQPSSPLPSPTMPAMPPSSDPRPPPAVLPPPTGDYHVHGRELLWDGLLRLLEFQQRRGRHAQDGCARGSREVTVSLGDGPRSARAKRQRR